MSDVAFRAAPASVQRFWFQSLHPAIPVALAAIGLGTLAFGAVYAWAYVPLALACAACGAAGLCDPRVRKGPPLSVALVAALVAVALGMAAQLVPLPAGIMSALSPSAPALLNQLSPEFVTGARSVHALSIWPRDTAVALALYLAFAALALGLYRLFSLCGARAFAEGLAVFGSLLALVAIVQQPFSNGRVYGFWVPDAGYGQPFGPFVNRNHFAGWMVMALPLTMALLLAGIERGMPAECRGWRDRILWFSSPAASRLILLGGASVVMALSLVMTMSRSGMTALALSLLLTGGVAVGTAGRSKKALGVCYLVLLVAIAVAWAGPDAIVSRFSETDWREFNHRLGPWADASRIARDFPLAGTGLNTYGLAALFYQRQASDAFFAQAHNDYLQLAAEGGIVVILPAAIAIALVGRGIIARMREPRGSTSWWLRAGAAAGLIAIAFQEVVEFSLQMPANAALFAVLCAIALHRTPAGPSLGLLGKRPVLRREVW